MANIRNFDSFGGCIPIFCPPPDKREIWQGGACEILRLSGQRVAPAGRNTHFWTTE